jgi:hypothetical protein
MTGAALTALPTVGEGHSSAAGVGMILAALVSYGFALNIARPLQLRNGALPVIWRAQMVALLFTAPLGLPALRAARWTLGPLAALLALGALLRSSCYLIWELFLQGMRCWRQSAARPENLVALPWATGVSAGNSGSSPSTASSPATFAPLLAIRASASNSATAFALAGTPAPPPVLFDDDPRERQRWLGRQAPGTASNSAAVRFFGTQLLCVRIDLDP